MSRRWVPRAYEKELLAFNSSNVLSFDFYAFTCYYYSKRISNIDRER